MFNLDKSTIEFIILLGAFVGNVILGISNIYGSKSKKKGEDIIIAEKTVQLIKEAKEAIEEKLQAETNVRIELGQKLANVEGQLAAKDELLTHYKEIFQGRNKETEDFMKNTTDALSVAVNALNELLKRPQTTVSVNNQK